MSKEMIRSTLMSNLCKVTFTKTNGEVRDMLCTLREDVAIPHEKKTERVKEVNDEVLAVWDCEKKAWRSFRFDSIINYSVFMGEENVPA